MSKQNRDVLFLAGTYTSFIMCYTKYQIMLIPGFGIIILPGTYILLVPLVVLAVLGLRTGL
jgi:hypothetical protein